MKHEFIVSDDYLELRSGWLFKSNLKLPPNKIKRLVLFTMMGTPSDALLEKIDGTNLKINCKTLELQAELKTFAIAQDLSCIVEEIYHGGGQEIIN